MTSLKEKSFWRHNWLACIWSAFPNDRKCYTFKGYNLQFTVVIAFCSQHHNFRTFSSSKAIIPHFFLTLSSVQLLSRVWLFSTPWTGARQASLFITNSGVCSNSCPLTWWCDPAISSSVFPFSSCPQSLQHQRLFQWVNSSREVAKVLEFQL